MRQVENLFALILVSISTLIFAPTPTFATVTDPCGELRDVRDQVPEMIANALVSPEAKAAFDRYQLSVARHRASSPFYNVIFRKKDGAEAPANIMRWTKDLNEIMGNRDAWVKWNIAIAERMRERSKAKHEEIFDSMVAVIREESVARGFGEDLIILGPGSYGAPEWRAMLREGRLFVDTFVGRGNLNDHTEMVHANQLLYVQLMLEARGYPPGEMRKIMRDFLGNTELIDSLTMVNQTTGENSWSESMSPWRQLFDAGISSQYQAYHPEWFGLLWHIVANDIPYDQIRQRFAPNYQPSGRMIPKN